MATTANTIPKTAFERTSSSLAAGTQQRLSATATATTGQTDKTLPGFNTAAPSPAAANVTPYEYHPRYDDPRDLRTTSGQQLAAENRNKSTVGKVAQAAAGKAEQASGYNSATGNLPMSSAKPKNSVKPLTATYPGDLATSDDRPFFQLFMGPYNDEVATSSTSQVQHDIHITLPLPANLATATALDYSNVSLGALGGEALKSLQGLRNVYNGGGDIVQALRGEVSGLAREIFKSGDSALRQTVVRRAIASVSPTLGSAIDVMTGTTPNPHVAVTFNNVKFRTFSYTWRFSPNKKEDSDELVKIIAKIHECALPQKNQSNLLLQYPHQCKLRFWPKPIDELFKFKPCVIESVTANYAPNGVPSFFAGTKLPTDVELNITFQEIQIRTSEDYQ